MTTAIKKYDPPADIMQLGSVLQKSGFFDDVRSEAQAIVKVMAGAEMGVGPIAAMQGIHVIKGKVTVGANLIAAAIKRSGRYDYRVTELTERVCDIQFFERGQAIGTSRFTLEDARAAGTQNLQKFPRNMLFARAMSNGARWYTPDVFGGPIYTPEEMGAQVDEDGDVLTLPAERPAPAPPVVKTVASGREALLVYAERMLATPQATDMERDLDLEALNADELTSLINGIRARQAAGINEVFDDV